MSRAKKDGSRSDARGATASDERTHGGGTRTIDVRDEARAQPGADAGSPKEIPKEGWKQIVKRAWAESKADNVPMLAAGVAFFAFLSLFPALIALISIWGLVQSPTQAAQQVEELTAGFPEEARSILTDQLESVAEQSGGGLGFGLVLSILLALWAASGGTANLIKAVNLAYDEEETRGFIKLRGLALLLTLGAIVFVVLAVGLVAVLPPVLDAIGLGVVGTLLAQAARWILLVGVVVVALAVVYRFAPDRDDPKLKWASLGAVVATVLWIIGSIGFSIYVSNFGSYNETYGAIAGVAILLLWLFLTAYIILLGAEINAETEKQTLRDTTVGPEEPIGQRDAHAADTLPSEEERVQH